MRNFKVKRTAIPRNTFQRAMAYALVHCADKEKQALLGVMYGLKNGEKEFDISPLYCLTYNLIGRGYKTDNGKVKIV